LPADDLLRIADGAVEVELLPAVGARLHRLRAFGHDLLRTPDDPAEHARDPFRWGAYVMAPWCNRIPAVPTPVGDRVVSLGSNFPDGSAIHGQVSAARWEVEPDGSCTVAAGDAGWPWPYHCTLNVSVAEATLRVDLALTNLADGPMPGGVGLHPWFRRPLELRVNADSVVRSNVDPEAEVIAVAGPWDLRARRPLPDDLDATWLAPSDPAVELRWPQLGINGTMHLRSSAGACVAVASPSSLDGAAIEPQSHAPQGLRRFLRGEAGAMQAIEPGGSLRLKIELAFEEHDAGGSA
jgi:aldose 1-epimerase